jgi:hemerythrin-like domain-containing protein
MIGESVLEDLKQEHQAVLASVLELTEEVSGVEEGHPASPQAIEACRERVQALRRIFTVHRCREEVGLFPDVEQIVAQDAPRVDILRNFFAGEAEDDITAHVEIEAELKELASLVERLAQGQDVGRAFGDVARRMADLLKRHATKEDTEVFPMMVRVLTEEQLEAVATRMAELCKPASAGEA